MKHSLVHVHVHVGMEEKETDVFLAFKQIVLLHFTT